MKLGYRFLALAASSIGFAAITAAQDLPPVPTKVLPVAEGPTSPALRAFKSPITGRGITIRVEPKLFDSDTDEEIERASFVAGAKAAAPAADKAAPPVTAALTGKAAAKAKAASSSIPSSEFYNGTDRRAAKLSTADGAPEAFDDVRDLLASLPSKKAMTKDHVPQITRAATSGRATEENRNVRVKCWLYAASREADNDYHLILGREPGASPEQYMTMEVSGLPPTDADSFTTLSAARKSFNDFFGSNVPAAHYDFYNPPIPVVVEGSIFFDITHATGTPPGPTSLRPNMPVIWEVHPITKIEFEPGS